MRKFIAVVIMILAGMVFVGLSYADNPNQGHKYTKQELQAFLKIVKTQREEFVKNANQQVRLYDIQIKSAENQLKAFETPKPAVKKTPAKKSNKPKKKKEIKQDDF